MEDIKIAIESIQMDGKAQFESTSKVITDVTNNLEKALDELNKASKYIDKLNNRVNDIITALTQRQAQIQAAEVAEVEKEKSDSFGVAELVVLCCGMMLIFLILSVLRRWLRYQIWDKDYLQRCCKNPEFLSKLNFPLKGCGCPRWKYCQCVVIRTNDVGVGDGDQSTTVSGDGFVSSGSQGLVKNSVYKDL